MAVLELADPGAFDPAAFGDFLDHQTDLGTKWAPRFVRITGRIPLTGSGKVDKRPLRLEHWKTVRSRVVAAPRRARALGGIRRRRTAS